MISTEMKYSENAATVILEGEIDIEAAEELRSVILSALGSVDSVLVDLEKVTTVSLSCLELLCATHKSAQCYTGDSKCSECLRERGTVEAELEAHDVMKQEARHDFRSSHPSASRESPNPGTCKVATEDECLKCADG